MSEGSATTPEVPAAQSHIIERPRLTKLLDESDARIILLVAPAGYGKTTLARQWLKNKQAVWYRATVTSVDVAVLSLGVGRAIARISPGLEERLTARLRGSTAPESDAESLAEFLSSELEGWPADTWLVVDDYHLLVSSGSAETFVDTFLALAPINAIVTSRMRPTWVSARRVLYGEIQVLDHAELALQDSEAETVLRRKQANPLVGELISRARGWPAVIGLAALADNFQLPADRLPRSLYEYFAEEIYQGLAQSTQRDLARLSALPALSPGLVPMAVGDPEPVLDEATRLGLLVHQPGEGYDLHPLLRAFLVSKLQEQAGSETLIRDIIESLVRSEAWDHAYSVLERFDVADLLPVLLEKALAPMLSLGRLTTLEHWISLARKKDNHFPVLLLAEAEVARRYGLFDKGEVLAVQAAAELGDEHERASHALAVAGECAHLSMRFRDALQHHEHAESVSQSLLDRQRGIWGQFTASLELETGDEEALLRRFEGLSDGRPSSVLRVATGAMLLASHMGQIDSVGTKAARLIHVVPGADDPLVKTAFLYRLAFTRMLAGRYGEALKVLEIARQEVERSGLSFVTTHAISVEAAACLGLRQFRRASYLIETAEEMGHASGSDYVVQNCRCLRIRLHLSRRQLEHALFQSAFEWNRVPGPGLLGESKALRALTLVVAGELGEAQALASSAAACTSEIEARTLSSLVLAIVALAEGGGSGCAEVQHAVSTLGETQNFDSLVCAYRAWPQLLQISPDATWGTTFTAVVGRARDLELGVGAGLLDRAEPQRAQTSPLTRREREVYELLCQGLTNKEIAARLYISEVTAKAHLRSIFSKLGVRTRTEAVLLAQELP